MFVRIREVSNAGCPLCLQQTMLLFIRTVKSQFCARRNTRRRCRRGSLTALDLVDHALSPAGCTTDLQPSPFSGQRTAWELYARQTVVAAAAVRIVKDVDELMQSGMRACVSAGNCAITSADRPTDRQVASSCARAYAFSLLLI